MHQYGPSDVRVVGLFGHRHSGKTSLVEEALFDARAIKSPGKVDAGQQTLELDPVALDRHTTMQPNVGVIEWNGCRVSLIDTPGDASFWAGTERAFHVADAGVCTVSAPDGVEPMTARAMRTMIQREIPFACFVTMLDKKGADFDGALAEIKAEAGREAIAMSLPIGQGPGEFAGVVNLLDQKAYLVEGTRVKEGAVPPALTAAVAAARERLFDAVAASDDALAERYLEAGELSEEELVRGLKGAFLGGQLIPVLAGQPLLDVGSRDVLDLIRAIFPSPLDRPDVKGFRDAGATDPVDRRPDPDGPLVARVFRTFHDPFAGLLTYVRIFSGKLHAGHDLYNATHGTTDRPSHMYLPLGGVKSGIEVKDATVGDVVVLTRLKATHTGDTLTSKDDPTFLPRLEEPEALLNFGVSVPDKKQEDKMATLIARVVDEDPSLRFARDAESKDTILGGLGQAHVDYVVERLRRQGVELELHDPRVPFRETLRGAVREVEGKQKKQTGGSGQFAVCYLHLEPLPRGSGVQFVDEIVGGSIPRNYIPAVEKGARDALKRGPISGNEVVDVKVTVYDGKVHRVDSSDMAFQIAARKGIRAALTSPRAAPVLLEPLMQLHIQCPAENVGDVMGDLNARRARVSSMTTEGRWGDITATVPMMEILRYTNVLKALTSGRGSFTMQFASYEDAPPQVQQAVAAQHRGGAGHEGDED